MGLMETVNETSGCRLSGCAFQETITHIIQRSWDFLRQPLPGQSPGSRRCLGMAQDAACATHEEILASAPQTEACHGAHA